ncbi:MAG: HlyD family efflux transporter periplasmic adaptor subunit [Armatimonadetes bacterium]|nr:HlyD family efflux transporter periplasmic adaptor subunit [Armatimonadota bacterium]NIO75943.1 HlyD family efflux transporter periplasmic adaptor subunit [Armatimonadota bacterium]NIO98755.1 HlyD family efflux transporter periplasmic adaptor subunit [Armatimonadota bacterium]
MRGTWLRIFGLLVFVAAIAVVGGWWMMRGQGGQISLPEPTEPAQAETIAEEPKHLSLPKIDPNKLTYPGIIEPYESVPVSAKLTANIASLKVRDGSVVRKGELLCVLDDTEIRQQIDSARLIHMQAQETLRRARETRAAEAERETLNLSTAELELESYRKESRLQLEEARACLERAQKELADYEALYEAKSVSADEVRLKREEVEDATRDYEQRQASVEVGMSSREQRVEQARLDIQTESVSEQDLKAYELSIANARAELDEREGRLDDTRITAPISGTVTVISRTQTSARMMPGESAEVLGPGVRVYEGDPFLEIAATDRACVRIEVDETDVGRIQVGTKAEISGDAFVDRKLDGEVAEIQIAGRRAGQGVSLFPVTVLITSPLEKVRMGMTADVTLQLVELEEPEEGHE